MRTYILSLAPQSYHKKKSDRQNMGTEIGKDFFKVFFTDYAITVFPLYSPSTLPPNAPTFPPLSSCPWVVHTSSLSCLFPIPFLTSPVYFMPTNYASYLYLPSHSSFHPPHWNLSMSCPFLSVCSSSSCLLSFCFHCFSFLLGSFVDSCEFVVILLFIFFIFFFLDKSL